MCVCLYLKIYLFIFGSAGSPFLRGLSLVWQVGLLLVVVWAYCDGFSRGAQALGTWASVVVALGL